MVTDNAASMAVAVPRVGDESMPIRHLARVAYTNITVKRAIAINGTLTEIRDKCRKIVGIFQSSYNGKEKLE
jgi:hypothetical protein